MADYIPPNSIEGEAIEAFKDLKHVDTAVDVGEETLFSARVRTYRFDDAGNEWKERGIGPLKILRNQESGAVTVVCRREQTHKLCMNFAIAPGADLTAPPSGKGFTVPAFDFSDDDHPEGRNDIFVIQFKTDEETAEFKKLYEESQAKMSELLAQMETPEVEAAAKELAETDVKKE